jgi:hypothetical protein
MDYFYFSMLGTSFSGDAESKSWGKRSNGSFVFGTLALLSYEIEEKGGRESVSK